jgi:hypothetical protein
MTRRWFARWPRPQFSLLTFLLFVTAISPVIAFVAQRRAWNARRELALEQLSRNNGVRTRTEAISPKQNTLDKALAWILNDHRTVKLLEINVHGHTYYSNTPLQVNDELLEFAAYFPELEIVWISHCDEMTDDGLKHVLSLKGLRQVVLQKLPKVKGECFALLPASGKLRSVSMEDLTGLSSPHVGRLGLLRELEMLELTRCPAVDDRSWSGPIHLPSLKALTLSGCQIGDDTLRKFLAHSELTTLVLNSNVSPKILPQLAEQKNLTELRISNGPLVDSDLAFLSELPLLSTLELSAQPLKGEFLKRIRRPERLKTLVLKSTLLSDEHLEALNRFENLRTLDLSWCPITGEGFAEQCKLGQLSRVALVGTHFTETGKQRLDEMAAKSFAIFQLPSNWTNRDTEHYLAMRRSPNRTDALANWPDPARFALQTYSARKLSLDEEPLTSLSLDSMAPVLQLHQISRQEPAKYKEAREDAERKEQEEMLRLINGLPKNRRGVRRGIQ